MCPISVFILIVRNDMKHAALFDLDGVILDTESRYTLFWEEIGKEDFPSISDFAQSVKGCTLKQIFDLHYPGDAAGQQRIKQGLYELEAKMDYPYNSGALTFVAALRQAGISTAIVTSSDKAKMENVYRAHPEFRHYFDHIFTAEDTPRSKPAPDCYLTAARYFSLPPQSCVVFEDSISGLKAARASGAKVVGLATTNPRTAIAPYSDYMADDFEHFGLEDFMRLIGL